MKVPSPGRWWWAFTWFLQIVFRRDRVSGAEITPAPIRRLGAGYGAWLVPQAVLKKGAVVYSAGVGTDTTFDEALIRETGSDVHAFDPTPRAIEHAREVEKRFPGFRFLPVGVWNEDTTLAFFAPENPAHVSHSITGLHGDRPGFSAPCKRLSTLMREWGHDHIDLLKIDIEGAEYKVLEDLLSSRLKVRAICVEFDETHSPVDADWRKRIGESVASLRRSRYELVAVRPKGNYTFLRAD